MFLQARFDINQVAGIVGARGDMTRHDAMRTAMRKLLAKIERHHKTKEFVRGGGAKAPSHPTKLTRRSGLLTRSYTRRIIGLGTDVVGVYGSDLIYASVHEFGGIIRAKTKKYLKFLVPGIGWRSVESVEIPARPTLERTRKATADDCAEIMATEIEKGLKRA